MKEAREGGGGGGGEGGGGEGGGGGDGGDGGSTPSPTASFISSVALEPSKAALAPPARALGAHCGECKKWGKTCIIKIGVCRRFFAEGCARRPFTASAVPGVPKPALAPPARPLFAECGECKKWGKTCIVKIMVRRQFLQRPENAPQERARPAAPSMPPSPVPRARGGGVPGGRGGRRWRAVMVRGFPPLQVLEKFAARGRGRGRLFRLSRLGREQTG